MIEEYSTVRVVEVGDADSILDGEPRVGDRGTVIDAREFEGVAYYIVERTERDGLAGWIVELEESQLEVVLEDPEAIEADETRDESEETPMPVASPGERDVSVAPPQQTPARPREDLGVGVEESPWPGDDQPPESARQRFLRLHLPVLIGSAMGGLMAPVLVEVFLTQWQPLHAVIGLLLGALGSLPGETLAEAAVLSLVLTIVTIWLLALLEQPPIEAIALSATAGVCFGTIAAAIVHEVRS